ncbi:hypothetical protein ACGF5M_00100 [Gemmatimonadota bacterium]
MPSLVLEDRCTRKVWKEQFVIVFRKCYCRQLKTMHPADQMRYGSIGQITYEIDHEDARANSIKEKGYPKEFPPSPGEMRHFHPHLVLPTPILHEIIDLKAGLAAAYLATNDEVYFLLY